MPVRRLISRRMRRRGVLGGFRACGWVRLIALGMLGRLSRLAMIRGRIGS